MRSRITPCDDAVRRSSVKALLACDGGSAVTVGAGGGGAKGTAAGVLLMRCVSVAWLSRKSGTAAVSSW